MPFDLKAALADKVPEQEIIGHLQEKNPGLDISKAVSEHGLESVVSDLNGREKVQKPSPLAEATGGLMDSLKRGGRAAVESLPFVTSAEEVVAGRNPYGLNTEGMARLAGDIGMTAGTVAGGIPAALKFAGASGALETAGVTPALRKADEWVDRNIPDAQTQSVLGNFLLNTPKMLLQTGIEFLPAALAGKAASRVSSNMPRPEVSQPTNRALGERLDARGIPFTESALKPGHLREAELTSKPETSRLAEQFKARQDEAATTNLRKELGMAAEKGAGELGEGYGQGVEAFKKGLGASMQELDAKVAAAPIPFDVRLGKMAVDKIDALLNEAKVPKGKNGYLPEQTPLNAKMDRTTAKTLNDLRNRLLSEGDNYDISDLVNAKRNFGDEIESAFGADKGRAEWQKSKVYGLINDTIKEALQKSSEHFKTPESRTLLKEYTDSNARYHKYIEPVQDALSRLDISPEKRFKQILNKGADGISFAKEIAGAEQVEQMALNHLWNEATVNGTRPVSLDTLKRIWEKTYNPDVKAAAFGPETVKKVNAFISDLEAAQAPQKVMGLQRGVGSQTDSKSAIRAMGQAAKSMIPELIGAGTGAVLGGVPGASLGGMATYFGKQALGKYSSLKQLSDAERFFNPKPGFYRQPPAGLGGAAGKPFLSRDMDPRLFSALMASKYWQENAARAAAQK